jgi:hypothetical protein
MVSSPKMARWRCTGPFFRRELPCGGGESPSLARSPAARTFSRSRLHLAEIGLLHHFVVTQAPG